MHLEDILKKGKFSSTEFAEMLEICRADGKTAFVTVVDDHNSPEGKAAADYVNSHHLLPRNYEDTSEQEIDEKGKKLLNPETSISEKKKILMLLAHLGVYESLQFLKEYHRNPDPGLRVWANMALDECKGFVRQQFSEEALVEINQIAQTGRNDPCPCGSGKKFKKCCGKGL